MDPQEKIYTDRHRVWQDYTIKQMSFFNNLLIVISIGFLGFLTNALSKNAVINFDDYSIFKISLQIGSLVSILFSIIYGLLTAISRLYDFKITRNVTLTRKRFYTCALKEKMLIKKLPDSEFNKPNICQKAVIIWRILFCELPYIKNDEIQLLHKKDENLLKFQDLRRLSSDLGIMSWRFLKIQILTISMSFIFFIVQLFIK